MDDILAYYYEHIYADANTSIEQIAEMCLLSNSHLFKNSIDMYNELSIKKNEHERTKQVVNRSNEYLGMLLSGLGLYFHYLKYHDNAMKMFELAIPMNNSVALAFFNNKGFETADFLATHAECDTLLHNIIHNCCNMTDALELMYNKILMQKILIDASVRVEEYALNAVKEVELKTYNEIKNAIEFASYSVDFNIEDFYNFEEINML